ncbi:aspartate aminotransferase family protein [Frigidibacter sp. MR17.24]|uniref:aspartate aminotransferase family protein n=1 Tax=Frigidibacter sp. MR17.24 TaxID=3127345 RepID=UPI003012B4FA
MPDHPSPAVAGVPPARIAALRAAAEAAYRARRPRTQARLAAGNDFLGGVPMHWMRDWPQPFPMLVARAEGAVIEDLDGNRLDDFCLGDTGSMYGHSPAPVAAAIRAQAERGLTYMLPTEAALDCAGLLSARFGAMRWQIATTATDANRFALRVARAVTGRPKVAVFDGCYHGTVDEAMICRDAAGRTVARPGLVGQVADLALSGTALPWNDLGAIDAALATGEIAAVLTEPVMTNSCMVLPAPGFLEGLRELCTRHGAVLILDETHTQSSGWGGYGRGHAIAPDMLVVGKCIAGGLPAAVWGMSPALADRFAAYDARRPSGHSGMGTTLSANPLQFACLQATLTQVATPGAHDRMEAGARRLAEGLAAAIARHGAPWHVARVGARVEFICHPTPLRDGAEARLAHHPALEAAIHAALVVRGCLIAPFHNMMLVSPVTTDAQIDRLTAAFDAVLAELFGDPI